MRSGTGKHVALYDETQTRIVRQVTPDELKRLEAAGKIGWFMRDGKERPYLKR